MFSQTDRHNIFNIAYDLSCIKERLGINSVNPHSVKPLTEISESDLEILRKEAEKEHTININVNLKGDSLNVQNIADAIERVLKKYSEREEE